MAFDLRTAKPVASGGFDLKSARPLSSASPALSPSLAKRQQEIDAEIERRRKQIAEDQRRVAAARKPPTSFLDLLVRGVTGGETEEPGVRDDAKAFQARIASNQNTIQTLQRERQFIAEKNRPVPKLTTAGRFREAAKALPAQAIESTGQILGTAGVLGPGGEEFTKRVEQGAKNIVANLGLAPSEEVQFDPLQQAISGVTGGIGSTIPYVGTELLGRGSGRLLRGLEAVRTARAAEIAAKAAQATLGAGQGAAQQRQQIEEFERETGQVVTPGRRSAAQAAGSLLGLSEVLPVPGMAGTTPAGQVVDALGTRILKSALQEGGQEGGVQLGQNVLEAALYNPEKVANLGDQVAENALLGAIAGGTISGATGLAGRALGARRAAPPPPPPAADTGPALRTTTIAYPNRDDPSTPILQTFDILSEPDEAGFQRVRNEQGRVIEIKASDLAELEAATEAYAPGPGTVAPPAAPAVSSDEVLARLRLASGVAEGEKEHPRIRALARDVTTALSNEDPVAAQEAVQARLNALAKSRMAETTRAQRQAELDEAQSIINDYRVQYAEQRAAPGVNIPAPVIESETEVELRARNEQLAAEDAARTEAERQAELDRLRKESEFESASLIAQGSPIRQAQTERQQLFDAIINDDTIPNPAGAFRQVLRDRGYPNAELTEAERRQIQARRAFTRPAAIVPFTGETITPEIIEPAAVEPEIVEGEFTEVPAPLPPAPPEVVAGAQAAEPSRRAQLLAGAAIEPGAPPAVAFGEEPAPSRMVVVRPDDGELFFDLRTVDQREEARGKLIEELKKFGFKDITVIVRDILEGGDAGGTYDPMDSIIRIAMRPDGGMMASILHHELIHYLKDHGFFTDKEWSTVLKAAKRDLVLRGIVEYVYRGETRANKDEEIVAEYFRNWLVQQAEGFQPSNTVLGKIRRFLLAIQEFFSSQGFRDAEAVLEAIRNGEFATREDKGSAKRAAYYAGTAEKPGRMPMYAGRSITRGRALGGAVEAKIIRQNLNAAEQMEAAGQTPEAIRVATGWERNPFDNQWRYLQSDEQAIETGLLNDFIRDYDSASDAYNTTFNADGSFDLQDLMRHSELYSIYPDARSIHVFLEKSGGGQLQGSYDPDIKSITLYADGADPLGTLLHEVQHWVQDKEGFAFGASPSTVWNALTDDQKRVEAQAAMDVLNGDLDDLTQVLDVIAYLNSDPEFRMAVEDGTAIQDLEGFFEQAFNDGIIVDDKIYALVTERLQDIVSDQAALGLADPSLTMENVQDELKSISDEIDAKNQLIEDIKDGDPTEEGSAAEEAARTAFEDHTRRNVIRYIDTAGEIEARDVTASRRLGQQELRERGMLKTERLPTKSAVVITYPDGTAGAAESRGSATSTPATRQGADVTFRTKMRSALQGFYDKFAYKYAKAARLDKQLAEALGVDSLPKELSLEDRASMFETMKGGLLRDFERTWFRPFMEKLKASGLHPNDLGMYLWARSAADRNAIVAERNGAMPDGGSGLTNLEAEAILAHYRTSGLMRQIEPLVRAHDQLVDWMLRQRVKSGLMSQEEADLLRKNQPYYTPLKGFAAEGDMQVAGDENPHQSFAGRQQLGVRPQDYMTVEGRSSMPFNPMFNLIADGMQLTQRIAKNEVGKRLLDVITDFPDFLRGSVNVYTDKNPKIVKKGIAPPGSKKKTVGPMNMRANANKFLVVKKDGVTHYIEFDESTKDGAELKQMFENMTPQQLEGAVKIIAGYGQFKKQLLTRFNPIFWMWNFGRDAMDTIATAFSEKTRKGSPVEGRSIARRTLRNMASPSVWRGVAAYITGANPNDQQVAENMLLLGEMVRAGGEVAHNDILSAEQVAKRITADLDVLKGGATGIWDKADEKRRALVGAVDGINEFLSVVLRFAAYKAAIDSGTDPDDAAKFALDSTLNLARKGTATSVVDNVWIFTNPALQSLEKKKRFYTSRNGRIALATMAAMGAGLHFWNMAVAGDDDDDGENDYQAMDEATKMTNLVIYPPNGGEPVKIPLGFMVAFEVYLGQQIARMMTDDSSGITAMRAMANALGAFVATQMPAGEKIGKFTDLPKLAVPDFLAPAYDLLRNENYFGSQIYPEPFYEGQAVSGLARRNTGEFYKKLAQGLNRAGGGTEAIASKTDTPAEGWKYLVDQYLMVGAAAIPRDVAKYVDEGAPADATKIPVVKRFIGDNSEYDAQNKYFERAKRVEIISGQKKGENADRAAYQESKEKFPVEASESVVKAWKSASKELQALSKKSREIQRKRPSDMEAKLDKIDEDKREIYAQFNKKYNEVKGER